MTSLFYFSLLSSVIFEAKYKTIDGARFKILTPKQLLQRLPMSLAQVNAGNTSENLLNKNLLTIYSLYQVNKIAKKIYHNIMNSTKL